MIVSTMPSRFFAATWMSRSASSFGSILPCVPAHVDEVAEAENCGERGAHLVLHRREEVRLHGVELAQTANRLALLLVETRVLHRDRSVSGKAGQNILGIAAAWRGIRWRQHGERADDVAAVEHGQHEQRPVAGDHTGRTLAGEHAGRVLPSRRSPRPQARGRGRRRRSDHRPEAPWRPSLRRRPAPPQSAPPHAAMRRHRRWSR